MENFFTRNQKIMSLANILKFIWQHPLNEGAKIRALKRFIFWQICSRILKMPAIYPFINDSRLLIGRNMTSATGNLYVGLMQWEEMAFTLHYLRKGDLFFDIGANVGVYSILAGKCVGSSCIAIEPIPETYRILQDNVRINNIGDRVICMNIGVGGQTGSLKFTKDLGASNRVLRNQDVGEDFVEIEILPLDDIAGNKTIEMIKIDTEGFESEVFNGGDTVFSSPNTNVVLMELAGHGAKYGFDEMDLHRKMLKLNYQVYNYDPFNRFISPIKNDESYSGDYLYIRNLERARQRIISAPKYEVNGKLI